MRDISFIIIEIIYLLFYSTIANKEIYALISEYVSKNIELTLSFYENMGNEQEMAKFEIQID